MEQIIENTIQSLRSSDYERQSLANNTLLCWARSPDFPITCLKLISSTKHIYVRYFSLKIFAKYISTYWKVLNDDLKSLVKCFFLNWYENASHAHRQFYNDIKSTKYLMNGDHLQAMPSSDYTEKTIISLFDRIIAIIALYEFPQNWETFFVDLLFIDRGSDNFYRNIEVIFQYVKELETCNYLDDIRLDQLKMLFVSYSDILIPIVELLITDNYYISYGFTILSVLNQWSGNAKFITENIFNHLIDTLININEKEFFTSNKEEIFQLATMILSNYMLCSPEHYKDKFFLRFLINRFILISEFTLNMMNVLLKVLECCVDEIDYLFLNCQDGSNLIDELSASNFVKLLGMTLLESPHDIYADEFWLLWQKIMIKLFQNHLEESFQISTISSIILPLLPLIGNKLAEYLIPNILNGRFSMNESLLFFNVLKSVFPSFLNMAIALSQESPSLSYFISLIVCKDNKN
ncbi:hypothetical protein TRFO_01510 [Tritrichomonas foetus]|uniref:Importin N-terminal domain-containing protein n=1 Tax=Tritrichomonas foetus TaxID=1144522 RepID=A0A1J4JXD5_9EUKA|nr:hypothetical protein TRFO_01510 [Tritrichomonas foetus]|eukprot:OHT03815.1 hypothetical protein TRFO_01510 [Tritrichomonas foetus]